MQQPKRRFLPPGSALVFDFPWTDSFADARNEALRHARGDWIFRLDADDRIDSANRQRLERLFAGLPDQNIGYLVTYLSAATGQAGAFTRAEPRLFRRHPHIRWLFRVHEQILPAILAQGGTFAWTDVTIHHLGYRDPDRLRQKCRRNLALLQLDIAERPDQPFILFNLGWTYLGLGEPGQALPYLRRSLALSGPRDSFHRKLFVLLSWAYRQLGQRQEALFLCRQGLWHYPFDPELLSQEGLLLFALGHAAVAARRLERLLQTPPDDYLAMGVQEGIGSYHTRHNLAVIYRAQGRLADAEAHWQAAVATRPDFLPAWRGLARIYLLQSRWQELEQACHKLCDDPSTKAEGAALRARALRVHPVPAQVGA